MSGADSDPFILYPLPGNFQNVLIHDLNYG
jgi:hypothetical protein